MNFLNDILGFGFGFGGGGGDEIRTKKMAMTDMKDGFGEHHSVDRKYAPTQRLVHIQTPPNTTSNTN